MAKGKAHERGLSRARARRDRESRMARRQRLTRWGVIGIVVLMAAALVLTVLPPPSPSPVVDDEVGTGESPSPTEPTQAATGTADGATAVACGAERPAASEQEKPTFNEPPAADIDPDGHRYRATIATSCGDIVVDLFVDRSPKTVGNFVALARMDYYAGVTFHRVIQGFMIQAGDPTGTGAGDPGYTIEGELEAAQEEGYRRGIIAMANRGGDPNTASTQFFIVHAEDAGLPPQYAVFGEVVEGIDVVDLIAAVPTGTVDGQPDVPSETVYIEDVSIEELPDDGGSGSDEESTP